LRQSTPPGRSQISQTIVAIPHNLRGKHWISVPVSKLKRIKWLILLKNSTNTVPHERKLLRTTKIVKRILTQTQMLVLLALDVKNKEPLGLVASAVLRCDDCVKYHLETSHKEGY
jgi:AhpD family alkylhydroperoxidase